MHCQHFGYHAVSGVPTQANSEPPCKGSGESITTFLYYLVGVIWLVDLIIILGPPAAQFTEASNNLKASAFNRIHSNSQPIVWRYIRPSFVGGSGLRLSTGGLDPTQLCLVPFTARAIKQCLPKVSFEVLEVFLQGTVTDTLYNYCSETF